MCARARFSHLFGKIRSTAILRRPSAKTLQRIATTWKDYSRQSLSYTRPCQKLIMPRYEVSIVYPTQQTYRCPVYEVCFSIYSSWTRHTTAAHPDDVLDLHFSCSTCEMKFASRRSVANHHTKTHGKASAPTRSDEDAGSVVCEFCEARFPSRRSMSQHVRNQHAAAASEQRAAQAATEEAGRRSLWTPHKHHLFTEALSRYGPNSNTKLASHIGSKTAKQVGMHKRIFLQDNPDWQYNPVTPEDGIPDTASTVGSSNIRNASTLNDDLTNATCNETTINTAATPPAPVADPPINIATTTNDPMLDSASGTSTRNPANTTGDDRTTLNASRPLHITNTNTTASDYTTSSNGPQMTSRQPIEPEAQQEIGVSNGSGRGTGEEGDGGEVEDGGTQRKEDSINPTDARDRAMRNCMVDLQALTGRTLREEEWAQLPPNGQCVTAWWTCKP